MCLVLYLGSDKERPTSTWNEAAPKFYVEGNSVQYAVEDQRLTAIKEVRSKFLKKHIYYVGSHEGCGCGFRQEGFWMQDDEEEIKNTDKNQNHLYQYILECLKDESSIEIYACWAGSENEPVESKRKISVQETVKNDFFFKEDEFIVVKK